MLTKWTQHLTDSEEKQAFQKHVWSAKPVLERIIDLIKEDIENLEKVEISTRAYESPNWAYRQADCNGYKRAMANIKTLIDLDQQRKVNE
jgi:hypothetical protein